MTTNEILTHVAAVLTTALETEPAPFPETMAYLAMGTNMEAWQTVRHILTVGAMATFDGHAIRLTAKGRDLAEQCNAARLRT